jgi:hypothetical protein
MNYFYNYPFIFHFINPGPCPEGINFNSPGFARGIQIRNKLTTPEGLNYVYDIINSFYVVQPLPGLIVLLLL